MSEFVITGPAIYTEQGVLRDVGLRVQEGIIREFASCKSPTKNNISFPSTYHLLPGFIDLHVHGANHCDVMDATSESLQTMSKALAAEGTTGFLATTMTASASAIEKALRNANDFMQKPAEGAQVLGIHLEGPFISPNKAGAQNAKHILQPDIDQFKQWQKISGNNIKIVTLAPELPNSMAFIAYLKKHNIVAAIGHSDATYAESKCAIECGCDYVTHLFNAMRGIHQREPGVVTSALLSDSVYAEMIVDGAHLHPAIIQLILKLKKDKLILVTDAIRAKCLTDGIYDLGGQSVEVKQGIAALADGTLAGSILSIPKALQNMLKFTSIKLNDLVKMTSENPAKVLGIFDKKGSISLNKEADFVVLDENLNVAMTVCRGAIIYTRETCEIE